MHRGRDKIPPVHKRYCPLSCMIIVAFRFEFGRNMFPRVQYNNEPALVQIWLTAKQATAHTMIIHRPQHGYTQVENSGVISRLQLRSFRTIALCLNIACIRTFNVWETKTHKSTSKTHPTHWVSISTNSVPATILPWCYFEKKLTYVKHIKLSDLYGNISKMNRVGCGKAAEANIEETRTWLIANIADICFASISIDRSLVCENWIYQSTDIKFHNTFQDR